MKLEEVQKVFEVLPLRERLIVKLAVPVECATNRWSPHRSLRQDFLGQLRTNESNELFGELYRFRDVARIGCRVEERTP